MQKTDRILIITRVLAAIIIPFLVVAFLILYFAPQQSGQLFAWPVAPEMTAMMLGAAYMGGVYYFSRVVFANRWHRIKLGLLPVTAFASLMGVATVLHWDRFTHEHIAFFFWALLYLGLPLVLVGVWLLNRREDPGVAEADDVMLPRPLRWLLGVVGGVLVIVSMLLFLFPETMIPTWPWRMTPLTARVMAAMFVLPGLVGLGIAQDGRWSAARIILQAQIFSIVLILLAVVLSSGNFDWSQAVSWIFVGGMTLILLMLVGITIWAERKQRSLQRTAPAVASVAST